MQKIKAMKNQACIISFIAILLMFSNCTLYRNMRPTGEYTTIGREKIQSIPTLRLVKMPEPKAPNLVVTFGEYPAYKETQNVKKVGQMKTSYASLWLAVAAGGIGYAINGWDDYELQEENGEIVRFYRTRVTGILIGILGLAGLWGDMSKGWVSASKYYYQEVVIEDDKDFRFFPNRKIIAFCPLINKDFELITNERGHVHLNLAELADLVPISTDLEVNFKTEEPPQASKIIKVPASFFSDLKAYYASIRPPDLVTMLSFDDATSWKPNQIIDGAEKAFLVATIENRGEGKALDVKLNIVNDNPKISFQSNYSIGTIEPKRKVEQRIPILPSMEITDGNARFTIITKEQRGYDARPVQIQIPVRHLDKPVLSFTSFTLNDGTSGLASGNGNGIVENGETVEITAFVKNTGVGASLNTTVNLNSVSPGAEIRQGKVRLGTIAPSETKQAKVVVAIPRTYSGSDLRLAFAARDTIGASQITKEHILPMSKLAPILAFDSRFLDSRGVQVDEVSNGSSYILEIMPRNEGQIAARSVQANVTASAGVTISNPFFAVGDMAAGASAAPIRFNFALPRNYNYGMPQFNLRLSQSDFADINQKLDIPFRLKSPNLIAREVVTTTDGNADIQQSETVDIDIVVENQGDLDAENVVANLNFTHTGIDFRERTKTLGRIPAGGQGRARFSFLVKTGATVGPLVGQLQVRQADGFAPVTKTLNYTINAIGAQIVTVTPTEQPTAMPRVMPVVRANTPPVVFLSLKNLGAEGKSYDPFVKLEIQIKDDKPLLAIEPEIRVNGRLQPKEQGLRGIGLEEREAKEDELKIKMYRLVQLSEGFNDIEIRVYDADNEMGMETTQVEYVPQRTDIWAIIIGVGDYQNDQIDDLKFAAADAQSFYDFIRSPEGGNLQADHVKLLLNRDATREEILRDMEWITSKAFENDVVYIYIALHGMVDEGELYFLAHDSDPRNLLATGVKKTELENLLQRRMKSNKIVWFADACHSGSLGEDTQVSMRASRASATNRLLTEISKARNGLAMLMSATAAEYSQEGTKWGGGHGVFTYFLLQGLRGQADHNKDNFVSVPELYDYVSRQVSEATEGKQNPILRGNYDRELKLSTVK